MDLRCSRMRIILATRCGLWREASGYALELLFPTSSMMLILLLPVLFSSLLTTGYSPSHLCYVGTLLIYHKMCLSHEVPRDHLEKPDRLRVAILVIHELQSIFPNDIDVFTNPPEGILYINHCIIIYIYHTIYTSRLLDNLRLVQKWSSGISILCMIHVM